MKISNEAKIGMMVSLVFVLLAGLTVKTGKFNFSEKGYTVKARFQNVDGVKLNSPVMFNGFEVGVVKDVLIKEDPDVANMELTLWIKEHARLRLGAKAFIKNLGFLGEKYVGLTAGDMDKGFLSSGAIIRGEEPPDLEKIIIDGQEVASQLKDVLTNVNERLEVNKNVVDEILANLNSTMKDMSSIVGSADERLSVNKERIDEMVNHLHALSVNLEELSYDLKENPWKIMYRSKRKKNEKKEE